MHPLSHKASHLTGSEIIRLAAEIQEKIRQGKKIYNFTVGDFDPSIFPIPEGLTERIIQAYQNGQTNYPPADGIASLKKSVLHFLKQYGQMEHAMDEVMIAGGGRPLIYAIYETLIDPGDKVIYPVPSWNNNHYSYLTQAGKIEIQTLPENNFMPTAEEIRPFIEEATMIALCSPLNPTGTVFSENQLKAICELVLKENQRRAGKQKPLYLLFDQIYWTLTIGKTRHFHPVALVPELKPYTLYVDGISKGFAATGVRIGWATGPANVIEKMKSILGHIGAWAPKAEQHALASFLEAETEVQNYFAFIKKAIGERLHAFYEGFSALQQQGLPVAVIPPAAAIYLSVKIEIKHRITPSGKRIENIDEATSYLLDEAGLALVPFYAFGKERETYWYRLSIGTAKMEEIGSMFEKLKIALENLK